MATNSTMPAARTVHAVCSLDCPDSCGVLVTVDTASGRAVKMQGDPSHPVTRGFLCGKVAKYLDRVYAPDRLLYPMKRRIGVAKGPLVRGREAQMFERISWDEALALIAARLTAVAEEFGPEGVLPYSYAGTIGQLGYGSMDRRFFHRLGASQLDRTICAEAGGTALKQVYGVKLGPAPEDFACAGLVIAWGANVHGNNVHLWPFIEEARRKGARLIVIDPYRTRTAALADEHLQINPGTDGLLALGMMHVIFREGLEDREYMAECTHGGDELRAHALKPEHAAERVAAVTGIAAETIERLAREYALTGRNGRRAAAIRLNYGIQRSENGGTATRAAVMLPLITGSWKHRGGGLLLSMSGAFPFNSEKLQMPELMLKSPLGRAARVVNMSQLGAALTELGRTEGDGPPVKAMFCYNSNPAAVAPNQNAVLRGLRRDDLFTVVHDQFFTDTADYADVVLPAPTFLESKDVQGAYGHRYAQVSEQAVAPLGEVRNNVAVFSGLARAMGFDDACFSDGVDELIDQALDSASPWMSGITRKRLEREGHVGLSLPRDEAGQTLPFSTREWFRTASGKAELLPVPVFVANEESRSAGSEEYPLEFLPRKADNYMNSTFANQSVHQKMEAATAGVLEMHADDAAARGVQTGDAVEVFNRRGRIELKVKLSGKVGKGVVAARLDWNKVGGDASGRGANVNALTSERLTDIGGGATFYSTLVEVRKAIVSSKL
jgi:anaerobic selenocysteine-containing dehydrogenase